MTTRPAPWKIVTFGAALTGLGVVGVGIATADDDRANDLPGSVSVEQADDGSQIAPADASPDASPESADSPNESATDSPADASPDDLSSPDDASPDDLSSPDVASADSPS